MSNNTQVPDNVAVIIAAHQAAQAAEAEERQRQDKEREIAWVVKADEMIREVLMEREALLPQWLLEYEATAEHLLSLGGNYLLRIGSGSYPLESLYFRIPGLSAIEWKFEKNDWRYSFAGWDDENPETMPGYYFGRDAYWQPSLEGALAGAYQQGQEYQRLFEVREMTLASMARREEEKRQPDPESVTEKREAEPVQMWTADEIELHVMEILSWSDNEMGAAQVRALLLLAAQVKRIADFLDRNDGADGILIQNNGMR